MARTGTQDDQMTARHSFRGFSGRWLSLALTAGSLAAVATLVSLAACGGGTNGNQNNAGGNAQPAGANTATPSGSTAVTPSATPAGSTAAPAAAAGAGGLADPQPGKPPAGATAAMTAEGDSIFHSQLAGGLCQTCHGPDAKGTPLAPPLAGQHPWRTIDGSYASIQQRIRQGMPTPTPPYTSPMLPMGGAQLTPQQIAAVAAYEYSISH